MKCSRADVDTHGTLVFKHQSFIQSFNFMLEENLLVGLVVNCETLTSGFKETLDALK